MSFSVTCSVCGRYVSINNASGNTGAGYTCNACRMGKAISNVNENLESSIKILNDNIEKLINILSK